MLRNLLLKFGTLSGQLLELVGQGSQCGQLALQLGVLLLKALSQDFFSLISSKLLDEKMLHRLLLVGQKLAARRLLLRLRLVHIYNSFLTLF